jgi:ABC-type enterobactin transport system permease subunit
VVDGSRKRSDPLLSLHDCALAIVLPSMSSVSQQVRITTVFQASELRILLPTVLLSFDMGSSTAVSTALHSMRMNLMEWRRPRLLLAGAMLEHEITVAALYSNAEGIEVFLLTDDILVNDQKNRNTFEMRLIQAGIVPTTFRQVLTEWIVMEADVEIAASLIAMKAIYEATSDAPR